ncbi:hypothetical protein IL306_001151 [Fusarium sp. DS 682]|nr:hypothetical protein IL306_001151 [Fusarium sp. DS 682]
MRPLPPPSWMPGYAGRVTSIITSIRNHPQGVRPTLESIPQINVAMAGGEPLSSLIRDMQRTDFKRWGFVIYRTVYTEDSQSQWENYIEFLKAAVEDKLKFKELFTLLEPHLEWTIIEDRKTLENASKQQVREKFTQWASSDRSVERDGPGAESAFGSGHPRYRYCIYVDQKCLDTFDQYKAWVESGAEGDLKDVVCVILDKDCKPNGQGRRGFTSIEGCSKQYTGWMYTSVECIPNIYNSLFQEPLKEHAYARPPVIFPGDGIMPVD